MTPVLHCASSRAVKGLSLPGARASAAPTSAGLAGNFLKEPVDFMFLRLTKADNVEVVFAPGVGQVHHLTLEPAHRANLKAAALLPPLQGEGCGGDGAGSLPPLQGEGWGGGGCFPMKKVPHPPPDLPLEGGGKSKASALKGEERAKFALMRESGGRSHYHMKTLGSRLHGNDESLTAVMRNQRRQRNQMQCRPEPVRNASGRIGAAW